MRRKNPHTQRHCHNPCVLWRGIDEWIFKPNLKFAPMGNRIQDLRSANRATEPTQLEAFFQLS
jgi:hypothetical protein